MLIYGVNEARKNITYSYLKFDNVSMSAICFWTTAKWDLPQFPYTSRKEEPRVTEFKTVACSFAGNLILIEIQRGKEGMKMINYDLKLGETSSFTKITMEAAKGIVQTDIQGDTNDSSLFDSWFSSNKLEEYVMDVGTDMIGTAKKN